MKPKVEIIIRYIEDRVEYRLIYTTQKGEKIEKSSIIYSQPGQSSYFTGLMALEEALSRLKMSCSLTIHIRNTILVNLINTNMDTWSRNGWKGSGRTELKYTALWKSVYEKIKLHEYKVCYLNEKEEKKWQQ